MVTLLACLVIVLVKTNVPVPRAMQVLSWICEFIVLLAFVEE